MTISPDGSTFYTLYYEQKDGSLPVAALDASTLVQKWLLFRVEVSYPFMPLAVSSDGCALFLSRRGEDPTVTSILSKGIQPRLVRNYRGLSTFRHRQQQTRLRTHTSPQLPT